MNDNDDRQAPLRNLGDDDLEFVQRLVLASGSLKDLAAEYGVSYPTIRGRLDKAYRQARAEDLSARAGAVVDKARGLITLEAEDAYLKWQQNSTNAARARDAADRGDKLAERIREDFKTLGEAVDYKEVLEAVVIASQARAQYNEAKFKLIVALASLERITGGGFPSGLVASK